MTDSFRKINFEEIEDIAGEWGIAEAGEARYIHHQVGAQRIGLTRYRLSADRRLGYGHSHREAEEMYVVLEGAGRAKVDDSVIDLANGDILRVAPECVREFEAGPDGMVLLATGIAAGDDVKAVEASGRRRREHGRVRRAVRRGLKRGGRQRAQ
jgi:quercetin dioxygenase-like cupin family protein